MSATAGYVRRAARAFAVNTAKLTTLSRRTFTRRVSAFLFFSHEASSPFDACTSRIRDTKIAAPIAWSDQGGVAKDVFLARHLKTVTKDHRRHLTSESHMSNFERCSSIAGAALIALAAYLVAGERKRMEEQNRRPAPPVEDLSEKLRQAWAGHHSA